MLNRESTFQDEVNLPAYFLGQNVQGQFLAGNGSLLVSHIFRTPEELLARFGKRLDLKEGEYKFSGSFAAGKTAALAGKSYEPVKSHGTQAVLEYGHGYLSGLREKEGKK